MKIILLITSHFLFLPFGLYAQQNEVNKKIDKVLREIKEHNEIDQKNDSISHHPLGLHTEEAYLKKYNFYKLANGKLNAIRKSKLSFDDLINLELIQHDIADILSEFEYNSFLNPILSDEGFHTSLAREANVNLDSKEEVEQYLILLQDIPRYVDEFLILMRKGLSLGISQPVAILNGYENTYTQHIVDSVEQSVFWQPLNMNPVGIAESDWRSYQSKARSIIKDDVIPSYRKIKDFFDDEYLIRTRNTIGVSHFPNGKAYYENRVRHYTTTTLTSDEIYQIGLKEVDRISAEMHTVMEQVNFKGNLKDFIFFLRTDPKFYPQSGEELLKEASFIAKKIDGKLPAFFGKLPRQPYTVAPVPDYLAPVYTAGRYSDAPLLSKKSGEYWVNTYNLPARTLYTLEALTLHEAVPGHHLQIALAKELNHLPEFRKELYITAFGEGWGLYSEYLGHEMGLYQDPYSLFGRLTYEMWRACRLVIDVGLHTKDWTKEQAVTFLADHTALSLHEVNTEINRYISWPGQALAYKIGEIKIKELRKKTEGALKEDFNIREFHDMVLSNGTVTLSILEKMTDRFIQQQLKNKKKS